MIIDFQANKTVSIPVEAERNLSVRHYLQQPQRVVEAIADPTRLRQLDADRYELKMRQLNFMDMYHFQPVVTLRVWGKSDGTVFLQSQSCEIRGIDYINDRFRLNVRGTLSPQQRQGKTYLEGEADVKVEVELPPALALTPKPLLKMAGKGLLVGVLQRIKQSLVDQLLQDYYEWADQTSSSEEFNSDMPSLEMQ